MKYVKSISFSSENITELNKLENISKFIDNLLSEHFKTHRDPTVALAEVKAKAEEYQEKATEIQDNIVRTEADDMLRARVETEAKQKETFEVAKLAFVERVASLKSALGKLMALKEAEPDNWHVYKEQYERKVGDLNQLMLQASFYGVVQEPAIELQ